MPSDGGSSAVLSTLDADVTLAVAGAVVVAVAVAVAEAAAGAGGDGATTAPVAPSSRTLAGSGTTPPGNDEDSRTGSSLHSGHISDPRPYGDCWCSRVVVGRRRLLRVPCVAIAADDTDEAVVDRAANGENDAFSGR